MRRIAKPLEVGILVLAGSLLLGRAAAGAEGDAQAVLPAGLGEALARREYEATRSARGLQAPNRAHGLRTYFLPTGIRVHERTAPGSPELLALALTGVGRGGALARVAPGEVVPDGARVEIRRPGLVEWYVNSDAGLEQGFTLRERPAGASSEELALELALAGATATREGDALVFASSGGRRLRYDALHVVDAGGRALPARFELASPQRVRIAVDDAGATYPVVIDPLLKGTSDATVQADQDYTNFGEHVASAGDVNGDGYADVLVGAPFYDEGEFDEGAVFVFHGGPSGIASGGPLIASAKITGDQALANLAQVAGAGDVNGDGYDDVIVGSVAYNAGQGFREGAAFVFLGGPGGIGNGSPANADAILESNEGDAWFGVSVAGAGDVNGDGYADVIVGAHRKGAGDPGAAYVFHGSASGIANGNPSTADTVLTAVQAGSQFGIDVAGAGDVNGDGYADVIVGADFFDNGSTDEGAAFVFLGSASGIADGGPGTQAALLEADQQDAHFGGRLAGAGDVNGDGYADVVVAVRDYDGGQADEGGVFVFHGGPSGIANANLSGAAGHLESDQASARLGVDVGGAGDVNGDGYADVIAGADLYDDGNSDDGCFFVLVGGPSGIGNPLQGDAFARRCSDVFQGDLGRAVAGAGDVNGDGYADVIAGMIGYNGGYTDAGAAFVYHGGNQGIVDGNPATAAARLESDQPGSKLGESVASAGDVNGDGYADVIVGAPWYDNGQSNEGAAFVFLGSASGLANGTPSSAAAQLESDQDGAYLGWSVASAGDVNGDGYADVIVGATGYSNGQSTEGAAFVFLGSTSGIADGTPASAAAQLESDQDFAWLGGSVASAGDVNGDGYADVIVGATSYTNGQSGEGAAFVYLGSASGIADGTPASAAAQLESDDVDAGLGASVASAGDVNGDGYADVIVGTPAYDSDQGAAFVYLGSAAGIAGGTPSSAAAQLESDQASAWLGASVASAGDVNGDGYADVIVGASNYGDAQSREGAAFVFLGSASGIADGTPASAAAQLESDQASARFGASVASAGDVNADGYADVIVGAPWYDNGQSQEGAAFVFLGSASGIADGMPASAAAQLESDQADAWLGASVASAGDVNGDGYADVIVGAQTYDAGQPAEGAAFVFYGNGNRTGRPVLAAQRRTPDVAKRVQPWGTSYATGFQASLRNANPSGLGLSKLELQWCPPGVPFGHASCGGAVDTSWTDDLSQKVTTPALVEGALYRWRARLLFAPFTVTEPGIASPPSPAHGPWRRLAGQAFEGDVRVGLDTDTDGLRNSVDPDDDGDGLLDVDEPTHGTNPIDADSDDDGLGDGAEVALGTGPLDPDHDDDGDLDGGDNCPFIVNASQTNGDAYAAGDACQCGDATGDGTLTPIDYLRAREHVAGRSPSGAFVLSRCDVSGDGACAVEDLAILDRLTSGAPASIAYGCPAYTTP